MSHVIAWWKPTSGFAGSSEIVHRTLVAEQDVDGLADLPIRQMIDATKEHFPNCREVAGLLTWKGDDQAIEWTWSYQTMRASAEHFRAEDREAILDIAHRYGCTVYDANLNLTIPPG
jgi:hypothetical protein